MEELSSRRFHTVNRLKEVRSELHTLAANRVRGKACVYATGSFGRCEASPHSDLDIFILGKTDEKVGEDGRHRDYWAILMKSASRPT